MASPLDQNTTQSRRDMICPSCQQRGLKEAPKYAAQCGNSKKQRVIYATACSNPDCENHSSPDSPARVPPEAIKRQYSDSGSRSIPIPTSILTNASVMRVAIGVIALIGIVGLIFSTGGLLSDNSGSAQATSTINESSDGVETVATHDPWTIYEANGEYYVAGVRNGETVYLNKNGEVVSHLVTFGDQDSAETAIRKWETRQDQGLVNGTTTLAPEDRVGGSQWTVYEHNGTAFIAAEKNGEVVYINSSLGVQDTPYFYDNATEARDALIQFESTPSGLVDSTDWETIEYGDEYVVGAHPDSGPREGDTVFLQPDGTVSEDPYYYDSESETYEAYNNFDGWDSVERETLEFDGSDDDSSGSGSSGSYSQPETETVEDDLNETEQTGQTQSGTVRGEVTNGNGEPVEGATVHMYSQHYTTTTNSDGVYEFTDIPLGEHEIHVEPPENSSLTATENTTIKLESDGITSVEDNRGSSYFMQEGRVSEDKINFNPQSKQPIQLNGEGTNTTASIVFANDRNADDVSVTLTDKYTAGLSQKSVSSTDTQESVSITGGADPQTQKVAIDGKVTSSQQSSTLANGETFTRNGNFPGENVTVNVIGQEITKERSVFKSGTGNLTNHGNRNTDVNITVIGSETTNSRSVSRSGTGTITNNGNIKTQSDLVVEGRTKSLGTQSQTGQVTADSSGSFSVDGNVPTNAEVTLMSSPTTTTRDFVSYEDDWEAPSRRWSLDGAYCDDGMRYYSHEMTLNNVNGEINSITEHWAVREGYDNSYTVSIEWTYKAYLIRDDGSKEYLGKDTDDVWSSRYASPSTGKFVFDGLSVDPPEDGEVKIRLEGSGEWNCPNGRIHYSTAAVDVDQAAADNVDVSVDGSTKASSVSLVDQSKTVTLDELQPGDHSVSIDGLGYVDYEANWEEYSVPKDVSVDKNNDGTPEIERSSLPEGESIETNVSLEPGETEISVDNSGPAPTWNAKYTERTASANIQAHMPGVTDEKQVSPLLKEGEKAHIRVNDLPPGEHKLSVNHSGPAPAWNGEFTEKSVTKSPTATIGQGEISDTGYLGPEESITAPGETLESKTYDVKTDSVSGPPPVVKIDYTGKATPEAATVSINGEEYQYPEDFDESGKLTRQTSEINITALTTGDNNVSVSAAPVDGIETKAKMSLQYPSESLQTAQPTVHVIQPDGTVTSKPVPQTALSEGQLVEPYTMSLEQEAFGDGENIIIVETPDGSQVGVEITGTSATPQSDIFEPTTTVPNNATLP